MVIYVYFSTQLQDYEALGISNVVSFLVMFFDVPTFLALPSAIIESFISNITRLTTNFGQAAALEEAVSSHMYLSF